ncbi:hypothetical protein AHiyo8_07180 [Arthrobacter sp. Hiyo8]|nr:hypothetical protein AHiyo8_07180 [Arthrobacter sp. Hiyo8]
MLRLEPTEDFFRRGGQERRIDIAGPIALTRNPWAPYSAAAFLVRPTTPCLAAV